jgi:dTDP-4-dehydrorhamnose reductase
MRILFISLLLLTLVSCAYSNFAWQRPALYYNDSKALAEQNIQQYLAEQNLQQKSVVFINGGLNYAYTPFNWWTASEEKRVRK